ncbi:hypothetical protein B0H13DRAFT_2265369 [Mycena leptocephala]|nr:hypothetical protein B0H13DRAFT_2265369 [Mycena leptocephala]
MLQIPTSALSLFSFSSKGLVGPFGGFFIAQVTLNMIVLSGLSVPKTSLYATRTTEIILMPTKCVPSNGTIHLPYVAAMGYAIVSFASLFSILRAKGFQALPDGGPSSADDPIPHDSSVSNRAIPSACNHIGTGTQPPSPPPDPGSSSSSANAPRRNPWMWVLLIFILLALVVVLGGYFIHFAYPDSPAAASVSRIVAFARQILSAIERFFRDRWIAAGSWISIVKIYISQNGRQLSKIVLLAFASHFVCLLVFTGLRRFRACAKGLPSYCTNIWFLLISITVIAFFPQLNWIFWMLYYLGWCDGGFLSIQEMNGIIHHLSSYLSSLAASHFVELSTIFGVIVMHTSAVCLRVVFFVVFGLPSTARTLLEELLYVEPLAILLIHLYAIAYFYVSLSVPPLIFQYTRLGSDWKQLLRRPFFCHQSRDRLRAAFWCLVEHRQSWKSIQIHDFHELTSRLPSTLAAMLKASLETWRTLPLIQQFLIVAPAVIFYGYVYIVPMRHRLQLPLCLRNRRGQWTHTLEGEHAQDHEDRRGRPTLFKDKCKAAVLISLEPSNSSYPRPLSDRRVAGFMVSALQTNIGLTTAYFHIYTRVFQSAFSKSLCQVPTSDNATFDIVNVSTSTVVGISASASSADRAAAVEAAGRASKAREHTTPYARRDPFLKATDLVSSDRWRELVVQTSAPGWAVRGWAGAAPLLRTVASFSNELTGKTFVSSSVPGILCEMVPSAMGVIFGIAPNFTAGRHI